MRVAGCPFWQKLAAGTVGTLRSLCSAKMGWRGEIELRDAENGHACAKRSHQVSVTTKLACALTVVLAAATITVGGSYGYVAIPTAGSVGMTSQVKNVSTVSPSEADGARKKKLRQAPDAVAETHPRGIDTQTDVDTKIAPKAVKDGDVQSDAPSTPSPTSLPYPTVTPNPTRWIRGCNRGRPLAEASIEQDPDVLSESADKTTQKKLVTSIRPDATLEEKNAAFQANVDKLTYVVATGVADSRSVRQNHFPSLYAPCRSIRTCPSRRRTGFLLIFSISYSPTTCAARLHITNSHGPAADRSRSSLRCTTRPSWTTSTS